MQNRDSWHPSKYIHEGGRLWPSKDRNELGVASRLVAHCLAELYSVHLPQHAKGRFLDLGCGKVPYLLLYESLVAEIICVDWPQSSHGIKFVDRACDLSQPLEFLNGEFDTILISDVLEHIPNPDSLWLEMSRILRPFGTVIGNVPFFYWIHEAPYDYYRYTQFALRRLIQSAGLEVKILMPVGGSVEILVDLFSKHLVRLPAVGEGFTATLQAAAAAFHRTRPGRRAVDRTGGTFPLGYFFIAVKGSAPIA